MSHQSYGIALITRGRFREAEAELRKAEQLDPLSLNAKINMAELYFYAHRFDLEEAELHHILELDPNYVLAFVMLSKLEILTGRTAEAIVLSRKLLSMPEGQNWCQHLADAYARAGQRVQAVQQMKVCPSPVFASTYLYLGDVSRALDSLETLYAQRDPQVLFFRVHPDYGVLQNQPRFRQMVKKVGL